jgi:mRNA interferase MazF
MIKNKIVLVSFPFDDLSTVKIRPAVCLTEPAGSYKHIIMAFISSRTPQDLQETDLVLDISRTDFPLTGLRMSSTIRLHRVMTVTTSLIQRELGELSLQMQKEVQDKLRKLFGL